MRKILVALDYSPVSKNAFEYALLLAKDLKAELTLLNVVLPVYDTGEYPREIIDFAKENEQHRATTLLKRLTTYYPDKDNDQFIKHNIPVTYLVKEGIYASTILQTAETLESDLIIIGTRAGQNFSKIILGSTAKELIKQTTIPTLVIPEGYTYRPIKEIAYATALEKNDESAYLWIEQFAKKVQATLNPFFISGMPYDISNEVEEVWESNSLPKKENRKKKVTVIRKTNFNSGVAYYLEHHPTDILAMFIPKRKFINQLFHISKTQQMVAQTNVPLLIYHAV